MNTKEVNDLIDQAVNPYGGPPLIEGPAVNALLKRLAAEIAAAAADPTAAADLRAALDAQKARLDTLLAGAPQALDTLAELAALLAADEQGTAALLATQQQHTQELANAVHRTGDENIAGHKQFAGAVWGLAGFVVPAGAGTTTYAGAGHRALNQTYQAYSENGSYVIHSRDGNVVLGRGPAGQPQPTATFTNAGRLGLGTDAPQQLLHLVEGGAEIRLGTGAAQQTPAVVVGTATGKAAGLYAGTTYAGVNFSDDGYFVIAPQPHADFQANAVAGGPGASAFVVRASGYVGVGTPDPRERLEVAGNVQAAQFVGDGSRLTGLPQPLLYAGPGTHPDGAMTQQATTAALAAKADLVNAVVPSGQLPVATAAAPGIVRAGAGLKMVGNALTPSTLGVALNYPDDSTGLPVGYPTFALAAAAAATTNNLLLLTATSLVSLTDVSIGASTLMGNNCSLNLGARTLTSRWYVYNVRFTNGIVTVPSYVTATHYQCVYECGLDVPGNRTLILDDCTFSPYSSLLNSGTGTSTVILKNGTMPPDSIAANVKVVRDNAPSLTPKAIRDAVVAGKFSSGELQGPQPARSLYGMEFSSGGYFYRFTTSTADTAGTTLAWLRLVKDASGFTPAGIAAAVAGAPEGQWSAGELTGGAPAGSLPRMRFLALGANGLPYVYEYMLGSADTDGTSYAWVRTLRG